MWYKSIVMGGFCAIQNRLYYASNVFSPLTESVHFDDLSVAPPHADIGDYAQRDTAKLKEILQSSKRYCKAKQGKAKDLVWLAI